MRTSKATLRVYDTHGRTPLELAIYSFYVDFLDKAANCYNRMSEPTTQHFLGFCPEDVLWLTEFFIPLRKHKEKRGDPKTFIPKVCVLSYFRRWHNLSFSRVIEPERDPVSDTRDTGSLCQVLLQYRHRSVQKNPSSQSLVE